MLRPYWRVELGARPASKLVGSMNRRLLQLVTVLLLLAGLEGLARLLPVDDDPSRLFPLYGANGYEMIHQLPDAAAFLGGAHRLLQADAALVWRLRPSLQMDAAALSLGAAGDWRIEVSAEGRRLPSPPRAGLVALGDSCTFGWGVDGGLTWPARLDAVNLGVPGYSSVQGAAVARQVLPDLAPELVVAAFGANDGHAVPRSDADRIEGRQTLIGQLRYRLTTLQSVTRIRAALFQRWAAGQVTAWKDGALTVRVSPARYEQALTDIAALAPRTVLLDVCARDEYSAVMASLAEASANIELIRYRQLGGETLDGCHPTPEGHARIAAAVEALR